MLIGFLGKNDYQYIKKKHLVKQQLFFIVCRHESVYIQYKEWTFQKPSVHVDLVSNVLHLQLSWSLWLCLQLLASLITSLLAKRSHSQTTEMHFYSLQSANDDTAGRKMHDNWPQLHDMSTAAFTGEAQLSFTGLSVSMSLFHLSEYKWQFLPKWYQVLYMKNMVQTKVSVVDGLRWIKGRMHRKMEAWRALRGAWEDLEYLVQIPGKASWGFWQTYFRTKWQTLSPWTNPVAGDYVGRIWERGRRLHPFYLPLYCLYPAVDALWRNMSNLTTH